MARAAIMTFLMLGSLGSRPLARAAAQRPDRPASYWQMAAVFVDLAAG